VQACLYLDPRSLARDPGCRLIAGFTVCTTQRPRVLSLPPVKNTGFNAQRSYSTDAG